MPPLKLMPELVIVIFSWLFKGGDVCHEFAASTHVLVLIIFSFIKIVGDCLKITWFEHKIRFTYY